MMSQAAQVLFAVIEFAIHLESLKQNLHVDRCSPKRNTMRNGYILCELDFDSAHVVLVAEGLPPRTIETTDWSRFPVIKKPRLLIDGTGAYFLLRIPGSAKGLYRALEELMVVAGVHRDGYAGLENHRALLTAVTKVRNGATDRVVVNFTLSPEQQRLEEMELFQTEEAAAWFGRLRCLEDPGCAEVLRRGR
jgi:hypothetical protein